MTRKNFLQYEVSSAESKKADAKKILSDIMETLSLPQLNALYQNKEVIDTQVKPTKDVPLTTSVAASNLKPVSDTLAVMGTLPGEDDKIVIGLKKPLQVVFRDDSEEAVDDAAITESYDFLDSAPPLDLSNDFVQGRPQSPRPPSVNSSQPNQIRSIEEDIEGYSVVGMDNDIGMNMLS